MKTSRIKLNLPLLATREDAEVAMSELAFAVNQQRRVVADRDAAVLAINKRVEQPLADLAEKIKQHTDALRAWAEANPDQFPKGRKSIDMVSGILGFRTGTPKLALLSRAFTWDKVLASLKNWNWTTWIRTKEEVDKEAILSSCAQTTDRENFDTVLKKHGLKVVQDESFFVEPKLTELPTRQTEAA